MLTWTLPAITAEAGGAPPFDMRPFGYTAEEARAFLAALTESGRDLYLHVQHRLDMAYPALLASTLGLGILLLCPQQAGKWKWALVLAAIPGSLFDYLENVLVARLLKSAPEFVDAELIAAASRATVLKSLFTTLAMIVLLVLFARWLYQLRTADPRDGKM
jgi:hypothetical protein